MTEAGDRSQIECIDYWLKLNPHCSISDDPWPRDRADYPVSAAAMREHLECIRTEGYFQTAPIVAAMDLEPLALCISNVVAAGHLSTYALLYDQFYHVLSRLGAVLRPMLGAGYQLVPDEFEAYFVENDDDDAGSEPHRDSLRHPDIIDEDGTPSLVNVWIPITDATALNSCIHVIPAHLDPGYCRGPGHSGPRDGPDAYALQDVRALPAQAGSVLCWSPHLLHWGGRSSRRAPAPRLSFAAYFQNRRRRPYHPTTMDIPAAIPFDYRLYLVEKVWRDPPGLMSGKFRHLQVRERDPRGDATVEQQVPNRWSS